MDDDTEAADAGAPAAPQDVRDPEGGAWFRARLAEVGHTKGSLSRLMQRCGDNRDRKNILRSLERMAAGQARVPGEMRVLLHFIAKSRAKRAARRAAAAAAGGTEGRCAG